MTFRLILLFSVLLSFDLVANPNIVVEDVYARATPPSVKMSAVFAKISNNTAQDRVLVSADSNVAKTVELHDVIRDGDVMKMREIGQIKLPQQKTTELKPGSLHIMLINLNQPLIEGEKIEVTLAFDDGSKQTLAVPVKKVMTGMNKH